MHVQLVAPQRIGIDLKIEPCQHPHQSLFLQVGESQFQMLGMAPGRLLHHPAEHRRRQPPFHIHLISMDRINILPDLGKVFGVVFEDLHRHRCSEGGLVLSCQFSVISCSDRWSPISCHLVIGCWSLVVGHQSIRVNSRRFVAKKIVLIRVHPWQKKHFILPPYGRLPEIFLERQYIVPHGSMPD